MSIKPVTYISINLGTEPDPFGFLVGVRVLPAGRNGSTVFGRTLKHGESDSGEGIVLEQGEQLVFPSGSVQVTIHDVDRSNRPGPTGYAAIANSIWTWLNIPPYPNVELFNYLFAVARRLDSAHSLCVNALGRINAPQQDPSVNPKAQLFGALGDADLMCVALSRAYRMIKDIPGRFAVAAVVPHEVSILPALQDIRDAFEHIDERAMGAARRQQPQDALSIFGQADFFTSGILRYGNHSLDLRTQVMPALVAARKFVFDVASEKAGASKMPNVPISFGPLAG